MLFPRVIAVPQLPAEFFIQSGPLDQPRELAQCYRKPETGVWHVHEQLHSRLKSLRRLGVLLLTNATLLLFYSHNSISCLQEYWLALLPPVSLIYIEAQQSITGIKITSFLQSTFGAQT
ncbi:hypothetical protein ACTFIU_005340 [Dictyostelium citrinum]